MCWGGSLVTRRDFSPPKRVPWEDECRSCLLGSRRHRECWIVFPGENQIWVTGATGCAAPPGIVHTACGFAEWEMDLNRGTPISDNLRLVKRRSGETETPAWTSRATGRRRWVRSHLPTPCFLVLHVGNMQQVLGKISHICCFFAEFYTSVCVYV